MKIFFVNGLRGGEELELAVPEITVGREEDNLLFLPVAGVSRYHGKIWKNEEDVWLVSDLGSTNGVKLNTIRITEPKALQEGDLIEFGDQMIRVTGLGAAAPQLIFTPVSNEAPPEVKVVPEFVKAEEPLKVEVPPPKEEVHPPAADQIAAFFSAGAEKLFDSKAKGKKKEQHSGDPAGGEDKAARRFSPFFFYTLIACLAVIGISAAMMSMKPRQEKQAGSGAGTQEAARKSPLSLWYVKTIQSRDNVFRFSLLLENGEAEFTIDDIKSQRHFSRREKITPEIQDILRDRLGASGIWSEESPPPPAGGSGDPVVTRSLLMSDGKRLKNYTVHGRYASSGFEAAERAIDDFTENYGLQTISLTPDELKRMAEANFARAEDFYGNREAKRTNLRDAIRCYRLVTGALEQFSPRPPMWERAKKRLEEAEGERQRKLDALEVERVRLGQLEDFGAMRQVFLQILDLADQDSREYHAARERLFRLDSILRRRRR